MGRGAIEDNAVTRPLEPVPAVARLEGTTDKVAQKNHQRESDVIAIRVYTGNGVHIQLDGTPNEPLVNVSQGMLDDFIDAADQTCMTM